MNKQANKTSDIVIKDTKVQPKDEKERQKYRKQNMKSSRFLDNYYNAKIHEKYWNPNGLYIIKKNYQYGSDTGLSHYYENQNVLEKKEVKPKSEEKVKQRPKNFIEFDYIEENDIIITIEHCSNCEDHQTHTNHSPEGYKSFAKLVQRALHIKYPFIKIFLKPIDTDIIKHTGLDKIKSLDDKYKEVRIGALEVSIILYISLIVCIRFYN